MDIILYAFTMQQHRSIYGAKVQSPEALCKRLLTALQKGAQVISIRVYR